MRKRQDGRTNGVTVRKRKELKNNGWWKRRRREEGGQRISDREMGRDKRSKASELQRLQLVAEPTVETKSKRINIQHDLQRLSGHCQCRSKAQ